MCMCKLLMMCIIIVYTVIRCCLPVSFFTVLFAYMYHSLQCCLLTCIILYSAVYIHVSFFIVMFAYMYDYLQWCLHTCMILYSGVYIHV